MIIAPSSINCCLVYTNVGLAPYTQSASRCSNESLTLLYIYIHLPCYTCGVTETRQMTVSSCEGQYVVYLCSFSAKSQWRLVRSGNKLSLVKNYMSCEMDLLLYTICNIKIKLAIYDMLNNVTLTTFNRKVNYTQIPWGK